MSWARFNSQFSETEWERQQRHRETRRQRTLNGECWQCAKKIDVCTCPNVKHGHPSEDTNPKNKD